jgi:hypothetical protein
MSDVDEWKQRELDAKRRFLVPTYTIKDQYSSPDAPFFCPAYYVDGETFGGISLDESFENPGPEEQP